VPYRLVLQRKLSLIGLTVFENTVGRHIRMHSVLLNHVINGFIPLLLSFERGTIN